MIGVGFEPTKVYLMDLKPIPFDRSGTQPSFNVLDDKICFFQFYIHVYIKLIIDDWGGIRTHESLPNGS